MPCVPPLLVWGNPRFPVIVWVPVKVLAVASSGILVVSTLIGVVLPPNATKPPPVRPVPTGTVSDGLASMALLTPPVGMLSVPLPVIGPPVSPAPLATLVTVPVAALAQAHAPLMNCRIWLVAQLFSPRLVVPPRETDPPPLSGLLAVTVSDGFTSMAFVTPLVAMLRVPLPVIGPPASPAPLPTLVTVPSPVPGND